MVNLDTAKVKGQQSRPIGTSKICLQRGYCRIQQLISGDVLRLLQAMKYRAYYKDIKCSPYEAMFVQPMKISNLPDDATEDIFTEEELDKAVGSGEHGDEQNNLTQDPVEEIHVETPNVISNDLVDNADMEGPVFVDVQEETGGEDLPSTEMVTEVARSPSMCFKHKNKIFEKRKTMKKKIGNKSIHNDKACQREMSEGKSWRHCASSSATC